MVHPAMEMEPVYEHCQDRKEPLESLQEVVENSNEKSRS